MNFRSRLAHLEGCLTRSQDAVEDKNVTIQRLEERLDELEGCRKDDDGERMEMEAKYRRIENQIKV